MLGAPAAYSLTGASSFLRHNAEAMLKYVLTIPIEPDVTANDLALALQRTAASLKKRRDTTFEEGDSAPVTQDGEHVGEWEIIS